MRPAFCAFALMVVVCLVVAPAASQTVAVYFDEALTMRAMDCPGPGVGTLYVVAEDFNYFLSGIEFKIEYPPSMTWLADLDTPPATIGNTAAGISIGWPLPQNGFFPLQVMRVLVLWTCADCATVNQAISVVEHPVFGFVRGVRFPDYEIVDGSGRTSVICPDMDLDIKPGSCPNPFNIKFFEFAEGEKVNKGGVMPVALLGSATFDASMVDLASLRLEGVEPLMKGGGPALRDVAGPVMDDGDCACTTAGPDGYDDIMMKFRSTDIAAAIAPGFHGERTLTLTGYYLDGIALEAQDCIVIKGNKFLPYEYSNVAVLKDAYPNPFNPVTKITYFIPKSQHVQLAIYDVAGRLVDVLVNQTVESGEHTLEWHADGVASGVYFTRMTVGSDVQVKRLTVLK
jgi:hypothetical protein